MKTITLSRKAWNEVIIKPWINVSFANIPIVAFMVLDKNDGKPSDDTEMKKIAGAYNGLTGKNVKIVRISARTNSSFYCA